MRVDVQKYLFVGSWKRRDAFFEKMQHLGIVEFISSYEKRPGEHSDEVQIFVDALRVLRGMVPVAESEDDPRSAIVMAKHISERNAELERLREEARILEKEIARVEIFGSFSINELHEIEKETGRKIQFFYRKQSQNIQAPQNDEVIYIGSAHGLDYYIAINPKPTFYDGMVEMRVEKSVTELRENIAHVYRNIDFIETDLGRMAHYKELLHQGLVNALNYFHLEKAKDYVLPVLEGDIFVVQAWVPKNRVQEVSKLADEFTIHYEPILPDAEERIPTHLENSGIARVGEDLVHIYDTPSIFDRDPSLWVFCAFTLFFSMILGDGGYGVVLLGVCLALYFKYRHYKGVAKRLIKLGIVLSSACIVWGILFASFFGIQFDVNSKFRQYSLLNWMVEQKAEYLMTHKSDLTYEELIKKYPQIASVTTPKAFLSDVVEQKEGKTDYPIYSEFVDNVLIELAIFIGAVHLFISLLRYVDKNWAAIGWCIFIIGGYLYFPSILKATSLIHYIFHVPIESGASIGLYLVFIGPAVAAILAIVQKRLGGMTEIMNVIQLFADVMSYLRIYALGLAGGIMAATFNQMGASAPLVVGIFIIIAGHIVNLTIGIMGGIIHGLRLNFIEWYHYSFEGGGKKFNPLKLLKLKDN